MCDKCISLREHVACVGLYDSIDIPFGQVELYPDDLPETMIFNDQVVNTRLFIHFMDHNLRYYMFMLGECKYFFSLNAFRALFQKLCRRRDMVGTFFIRCIDRLFTLERFSCVSYLYENASFIYNAVVLGTSEPRFYCGGDDYANATACGDGTRFSSHADVMQHVVKHHRKKLSRPKRDRRIHSTPFDSNRIVYIRSLRVDLSIPREFDRFLKRHKRAITSAKSLIYSTEKVMDLVFPMCKQILFCERCDLSFDSECWIYHLRDRHCNDVVIFEIK